jgi:hypothetical protein
MRRLLKFGDAANQSRPTPCFRINTKLEMASPCAISCSVHFLNIAMVHAVQFSLPRWHIFTWISSYGKDLMLNGPL